MTRSQAAKLAAGLMASFTRGKSDPDRDEQTARAYEDHLVDLDFGATATALQRLIRTEDWLPSIAKIRRLVAELTGGRRRTGSEAWAIACRAARLVGSRSPEPSWDQDPLIGKAIRLWPSWSDFCQSPNDMSDRARFIEYYEQLAERQQADAASGFTVADRGDHRAAQLAQGLAAKLSMGPSNERTSTKRKTTGAHYVAGDDPRELSLAPARSRPATDGRQPDSRRRGPGKGG